MNILIVGASGNIGSKLYDEIKQNYSIYTLGYRGKPIGKKYYSIDLTDEKQVSGFVENSIHFDIIIFLVGLAHKKGSRSEFFEFNTINYSSLKNLLSTLSDYNKIPKKIIFASTISVYGEKYNKKMYLEDSILEPLSPYARTKLKAEKYLIKNFQENSWLLRFAPVYSNDFLLNINRRTKILNYFYKIGDGNNKLSLCNLRNIIFVINEILNEKIPFGVYNLSDLNPYSYKELIDYQNPNFVFRINRIFFQILYYVGKIFGLISLRENCIKLLTDNIYSSEKIHQFSDLPFDLKTLKINNN